MNAELKSKVESYLKNTSGRKIVGRELVLELFNYYRRLDIDNEHLVNNYNHTINAFKKLNIEHNKLEADLKLERDSVKSLITSIDKLEKTKQNQKILISFLFVGITALALAFIATII